MKELNKEIDRVVSKYPWEDSKELFRSELKYLVEQARKKTLKEIQRRLKKEVNKWNDRDIFEGIDAISFISDIEWHITLLQDDISKLSKEVK